MRVHVYKFSLSTVKFFLEQPTVLFNWLRSNTDPLYNHLSSLYVLLCTVSGLNKAPGTETQDGLSIVD